MSSAMENNILDLVYSSSEILHRPCDPFVFDGKIDPEQLTDQMFSSMFYHRGIGLSACQVGINTRVFVIGYGVQGDLNRLEFFNPKIIEESKDIILMHEGCLSYPGIELVVKRPESIIVSYQNSKGDHIQDKFTGLTARVFLHEYDHMEGITFKSKVSRMKWDLANKKRDKLIRRK
jgi:peptide deformylase